MTAEFIDNNIPIYAADWGTGAKFNAATWKLRVPEEQAEATLGDLST